MKKILQLFCLLLLAFPAMTWGECIEGDCTNGFGIYIFPEGGQYAGQFAAGKFAGEGSQEYADGKRYEGMFVDSAPHGDGKLLYTDGSEYTGDFEHGAITGQGTIIFASGSKYEGDFKKGLFHGTGLYTYADGSKYKGKFENGLFHGKGTMYSDGQVYIGLTIDDRFDIHFLFLLMALMVKPEQPYLRETPFRPILCLLNLSAE